MPMRLRVQRDGYAATLEDFKASYQELREWQDVRPSDATLVTSIAVQPTL